MRFRVESITALWGVVLLGLCLGCNGGEGAGRTPLSGKVTFGGQPVPYGLIYFSPDVTQGNMGPQGYAEIVDGHYSTEGAGMGTVTGPLIVQVAGFPRGKNEQGAIEGSPLFPRYKTMVHLKEGTTTMDFEVPLQAVGKRLPQ